MSLSVNDYRKTVRITANFLITSWQNLKKMSNTIPAENTISLTIFSPCITQNNKEVSLNTEKEENSCVLLVITKLINTRKYYFFSVDK